MRVSVIQMNPGSDKAENIAQARRLIEEAVEADRPDIVSLPEIWDQSRRRPHRRNANAEVLPPQGSNEPGGPAYEFLRETGARRMVHVHGGSIIEEGAGEAVQHHRGLRPGRHRDRPLPQDPPVRHRRPRRHRLPRKHTYGAGDEVVTYQAGGINVGCAICYDIRFPDLFWSCASRAPRLIFLPSTFTLATGKDHWEVLIRARAIETQCWFAAAATWGKHLEGKGEARFTYGHSMVVDPWGHVVAKVSDGIGWATARIDPKVTARVRRDMPVLEHRKRV